MCAKNLRRRTLTLLMMLGLAIGLFGMVIAVPAQLRPIQQKGGPFLPYQGMDQPEVSVGVGPKSGISLVDDQECREKIKMASEAVSDKDWKKAVQRLQLILENNADSSAFVEEIDANGVAKKSFRSGKVAAGKLFRMLPDEALDIYEAMFGAQAKIQLDEAKTAGDREELAEVAQKFQYTQAGIEANDLLATHYLDRGQYFMAALRFEQLLAMNPKRTKISDLTLFKAALAFKRAGDDKNFEDVRQRLEPALKAQGGLSFGGNLVPTARIDELFKENIRDIQVNPHDWLSIRGNGSNSAQANGSQPLLDRTVWERSILVDGSPYPWRENEGQKARAQIEEAVKSRSANTPVLPGFFPIATTKLAIYRTYVDVRAVYMQGGTDTNGKPFAAGDVAFRMGAGGLDGSLSTLLDERASSSAIENSLNQSFSNFSGKKSFLYENSLLGTIYCDQRLVYAVDDLAVPLPVPIANNPYGRIIINPNTGLPIPAATTLPANLRCLMAQNTLRAFSIQEEGKQVWALGVSPNDSMGHPESIDNNPFGNSHFLSVPLAVGGKLYVLNEKHAGDLSSDYGSAAELRLVCIDPNKMVTEHGIIRPTVVSIQKLGKVEPAYRFTNDATRRMNAAHLAYGDGFLVCTTNAGMVLGVDMLSGSLAWSYPYRQIPAAPLPFNINGGPMMFPQPPGYGQPNIIPASQTIWKSSPPVIQDGRVVFTAPDAGSVHCINLRDGAALWERKHQEGDLFLAGVYAGKVLIVSKNSVRALSLKNNGEQLWQMSTGDMPSGQGVAAQNVYYLPLQSNEILAIDIATGTVKAHNRATQSKTAPGNLVFCNGLVLSQTPEKIVAYPQLTHMLDLASNELKADPGNPEKLFKRGEMLLADGQVDQSVKDLRLALKNGLPDARKPEARARLYEALTDLLHTDFARVNTLYLDEYRQMCKAPDDPDDEPRRMAGYYRIVGEGNETTGNLVEAFQNYRKFGSLPYVREGVASPDDPTQKVPINVWLRGRISTMMLNAPAEKREPLETRIADEWKEVKGKKDLDAVRSFVDMFDVPVPVGRQARLQLAQTIIENNERSAFLEAELNLQQLLGSDVFKDADLTALARLTLARLEEKKGTADAMKQAAAYYRDLSRDFPDRPIAPAQPTGSALFDDLASDPRYLPYLAEPDTLWKGEKIGARETRRSDALPGYVFVPEGDVSPVMKQCRLMLVLNERPYKLQLYNFATDTVRWSVDLSAQPDVSNFSQIVQAGYGYNQPIQNRYDPNARFRFYQVRGNLAVIQLATMVFCLDMDNGRILWHHSFLADLPAGVTMQRLRTDVEGNVEIETVPTPNSFGNEQKVIPAGRVGSVQASHVALITPRGLIVLDPLRGTILWQKKDVPPRTRVFGDEQYLCLIEESDGKVGSGRVVRAIDGSTVKALDFGSLYQNRVGLDGRKILAAMPGAELTVKMTDVVTGKDLWSHSFPGKSVVLKSENPGLTGVIDPKGRIVVIDTQTGRLALDASVLKGQVEQDDVARLSEPLLLADRAHFYVALNRPIDDKKAASGILSNFANGLRCRQVNGWMLAYFRADGQHKVDGKLQNHKKGDFHWHSFQRIENQLVVVEQFESLPVLLFTARHQESGAGQPNMPPGMMVPGLVLGNARYVSVTKSLQRSNGKEIYDPARPPAGNFSIPVFATMSIDPREGTINLIGVTGSDTVQHYVDDGTRRPPAGDNGVRRGPDSQPPPPDVLAPPVPPPVAVPLRPRPRLPRGIQVPAPRLPVPPPN